MSIPRPEYPRPQFERPDWENLNGTWEFEIDQADTGVERGLRERPLSSTITVPFAPESTASGVGIRDQLTAVWYRRHWKVPAEWQGRRIMLHFGAVDHDTTVWVNGVEVGRHRGGFTSFSVDTTAAVTAGSDAIVVVRARDTARSPQARGKQARDFAPTGTFYPRTTGIWQTVWAEPVPHRRIGSLHVIPSLARGSFSIRVVIRGARAADTVQVVVTDASGVVVGQDQQALGQDFTPELVVGIASAHLHLWEPGRGYLYGLTVRLVSEDGQVLDQVASYAGMRSIAVDGTRVLINGKPVFQRLVLDQGYWPDTLMTAPSDAALVADIATGLAAGFNGARAHQKVFEERYLYHADRMGYLVWAEFGDWGVNEFGPDGWYQTPTISFVTQWLEAVGRDRNHPAIVGWCPLNEFQERITDRITDMDDVARAMFLGAKLADPTRPVLDASGFSHRLVESDVYDSHSYEQDPECFLAEQAGLAEGTPYVNTDGGHAISVPYAGQPYFVSEFGGIHWSSDADTWGYGDEVSSLEELYVRFEGLVNVLLEDPNMFGYCYTQLSDVESEHNGIVRYDRSSKLDLERLRQVQTRPAAIERRDC